MEKSLAEQTVLKVKTSAEEREEVAARLAVHQESRSALGKKLGLDVGMPNEMAQLSNGQLTAVRDDLGLLLDTRLYASRKCSDCYARGLQYKIVHVPAHQARQLIADDPRNEMVLTQTAPGKWISRRAEMCWCAKSKHARLHEQFAGLLIKNRLAIRVEGMKGSRYDLL